MKIKLLFLFLSCYAISYSQNQETKANRWVAPYEKYWLFQTSLGANIDLIHTGAGSNVGLLGTRPDVAPVWSIRLAHLFSRRIGWYADIQMSFYKEKKAEYANSGLFGDAVEDVVGALFWPVSIMRPSINGGIVYRIESDRWNIYPGIGFGYACYLPSHKLKKSSIAHDQEVFYKQRASSLFLNFGLSANYFISENIFLVLNADYQQPIQQSYAKWVSATNENETNKMSYKTTTAGRILNLSFGIGLAFGR